MKLATVKAAGRRTVHEGWRVLLSALLLAWGLWLIHDNTILWWDILTLPAAVGALGMGYWALRHTLFYRRDLGAIDRLALLVALAIVIAGVVGV